MAQSQGNRLSYLIMGTGVLFVWAGWANKSVLDTLKDVIAGKQPTPGPGFHPFGENVIPGTGTPDPSINTGSPAGDLRGVAQGMLNDKGMGKQFPSMDKLVTGESGWNPLAQNPSGTAFGIAQALGHGGSNTASPTRKYTAGPKKGQPVNSYGAQYGLLPADAQAANSGDGPEQIRWMIGYVRAQYGTFDNAYMKWLSRSPHWY